jgi:hypothetical protein
MSTSIAVPELNHERGFLALQDPLARLTDAFDAWEELAHHLPKVLVSDQIRARIADLPPSLPNGGDRRPARTRRNRATSFEVRELVARASACGSWSSRALKPAG